MPSRKKRSLKQQLALLVIALTLGMVGLKIAGWNPLSYVNIPVKGAKQKVYASQSEAIFAGDLVAQKSLANQAIAAVQQNIDPAVFKTGSPRYNAEWTIATYQLEFGLIVSNRSLRIGISKVTQSLLETG
jgi:hypothetical protein